MRNKAQGFTLIELLIVIAIIGILAAVLIPNLLSARNRANDTAAQAYLREGVTQQEIYQIDNGTYGTDALLKTDAYIGTTPPTNVVFNVVDESDTGYCMTASNTAGTANVVFFATASGGLVRSQAGAPAVCTVAN